MIDAVIMSFSFGHLKSFLNPLLFKQRFSNIQEASITKTSFVATKFRRFKMQARKKYVNCWTKTTQKNFKNFVLQQTTNVTTTTTTVDPTIVLTTKQGLTRIIYVRIVNRSKTKKEQQCRHKDALCVRNKQWASKCPPPLLT